MPILDIETHSLAALKESTEQWKLLEVESAKDTHLLRQRLGQSRGNIRQGLGLVAFQPQRTRSIEPDAQPPAMRRL
ncbi:hypothetical protein [Burkholderia mayonis]|uniref:Uncharacterized protein n=1 Tax=Burkholderia mayonis TaxID=1385591 RepID=A0A1B4FKI5_9BURK|nr:hypothetical protein WS70_20220 [Burkholderia mayonis]KVE38515.1 hypothetical protein WS69_08395 [Burkholderia sp. BDU5]KVE43679.1 hypothetical protein WS70_08490 [Burkholderia mayonis]